MAIAVAAVVAASAVAVAGRRARSQSLLEVRFGQVGESGIITYYWREVARMHRRQGLSVEAIARSVSATPDEVQSCLYRPSQDTLPPLIAYPSFLKRFENRYILEIWQRADDAVRKADELEIWEVTACPRVIPRSVCHYRFFDRGRAQEKFVCPYTIRTASIPTILRRSSVAR